MAVKKAKPAKTSSKSQPATGSKAAPSKPAAAKPTPAAPAPKGGAKKAAAVKLSAAQDRLLATVHQAKEAGYLGKKSEAKTLEVLLQKKMIKRGKKENGASRYLVTKAGANHVPVATAPAPAVTAPAPAVTAPEASAPASAPV